jgi:NADPH-dependent 2,4-dienoyl-CoA reductase/sulfur reductase-like enzyme/pSer/pThr/pTyr-binding forkhead associated (FHA) protein
MADQPSRRDTSGPYVIIGNGVAGVTAAEILRAEDSAADITVIADDPFPVYYRPALKDYLAGRVREDKLWARATSFYQDQRIRFISERVVGIQVGQHCVQLQNGRQARYARLLLANGARPSTLKCPGINLVGVTTLRTVADYQLVQSRLNNVRRIVVTGSGTLALETIETLRHRGFQVVHLLRRRTLWSEVLDVTASDLVLQQEKRDDVDVRLEEEIAEITGKDGQVTGVVTTRGARIPCDLVIIAIGIDPIIDFVKASGIPCGRGVQVDAAMRTSAPDVYAAGDILETTDVMTKRTRLLGQWYPAIQQARAAAYSMLDLLDNKHPFRSSTFYNATFLYGLDFASVGQTSIPRGGQGYQEIIADPQPREYRKVLLKDGVPVGMLALGDRKGALAFKRAIDHGINLLPVASKLFVGEFNLSEWLDKQGVPPPILSVNREGAVAVAQATLAVGPSGTKIEAGKLKDVRQGGDQITPPQKPQSLREAFLVPSGEVNEPKVPLSQTKVMTIGRQEGVFLLVDQASVSRRHAEISYANGQYVLRDLGSSYGTFVNDKRLEKDSIAILKQGDRIRFGNKAVYTFQSRTAERLINAPQAQPPAARSLTTLHHLATAFYDPTAADQALLPSGQPILDADGSLKLPGATSAIPASVVATLKESPALIMVDHGKPEIFRLKSGKRMQIGRDKKCDIMLADVVVSRLHAEVIQGMDGFYIRDRESSNGVMVNRTKIDNPYRLSHGDRIAIGSTMLYFINQDEQLINPQFIEGQAPAQPSPAVEDLHHAQRNCPNCGISNNRIARFCANCGAPLENPEAGFLVARP